MNFPVFTFWEGRFYAQNSKKIGTSIFANLIKKRNFLPDNQLARRIQTKSVRGLVVKPPTNWGV